MKLIDTHCHLDAVEFSGTISQIIAAARHVGVTRYVVPGIQPCDWKRLQKLSIQFDGVFTAPGIHPLFVGKLSLADVMNSLEQCLLQPKVVAIGEIGLDFYDGISDMERQRQFFLAQLQLAIAAKFPVLLHVRKAHDSVLSILRKVRYGQRGCGGIVHAYSGSFQQAQHYLQQGFCLGFGGNISYPRAIKIRAVAREITQDALVLETDAPYMPLKGGQGRSNLPQNLPVVLQHLAQLRGEERGTVAEYTCRNVKNILPNLFDPVVDD